MELRIFAVHFRRKWDNKYIVRNRSKFVDQIVNFSKKSKEKYGKNVYKQG